MTPIAKVLERRALTAVVSVLLGLVNVALDFRRRYFRGTGSTEPVEQTAPSQG